MSTLTSGGNGNNSIVKPRPEENYDGPITDADLERLVMLFGAELHAAGFKKATTRKGLQIYQEEIAQSMAQMIKKYASRFKGFVVRPAVIDSKHFPQKAVEDTRMKVFLHRELVQFMPEFSSGPKNVTFFNLGYTASDEQVEVEYAMRRLRPDPIALCAVNRDDQKFSTFYPNAALFKDGQDKICYIAFNSWNYVESRLYVAHTTTLWGPEWWFGGTQA